VTLAHRPADPEDQKFIVDSWTAAYRASHAAGLICMDDWQGIMSRQVEKVLARDGVETIVAYRPNESRGADLYGWICVERDFDVPAQVYRNGKREELLRRSQQPLVHFVMTKLAYRRLGIARGLFAAARVSPTGPFLYTCKTSMVQRLADKIPNAKWAPLIARHPKTKTEP